MRRFVRKKLYQTNVVYEPLPIDSGAIRLLTIQPAKRKTATVKCTLSSATLRNDPPFEALSYVWGDPEDLLLIIVDGKRFAVTRNLLEALQALRLRDATRTFWIDAICINQADNREKSIQVSIMRQIYSKATHVVIWLGEPTMKITRALNFMRETLSDDHAMHSTSRLVEQMGDDTLEYWSAVSDLFDRAWFTRIWVCQEFAFANSSHFQCGSVIIPGSLIVGYVEKLIPSWSKVIAWFVEHDTGVISTSDPHPVRRFVGLMQTRAFPIINMTRMRVRPPELQYVLSGLITRKEATDYRDRIYALLGFVQIEDGDPYKELVFPNYGLSIRQVFTRTMAYLMLTRDNLDVLNEVRVSDYASPELPSWVANWEPGHASLIFTAQDPTHTDSIYGAGGKCKLEPDRIDLTAETIRLDGYTVDVISDVFCPPRVMNNILLVKHWLQILTPYMNKDYPLGGSYREAFWRTIFGNRYPQEFEQESGVVKIYDVKMSENIPGLCKIPPATEDEQDDLHSGIDNGPVRDGFRLFITNGGLLGLVHKSILHPHTVVVFLGGTSPHVVEPCGTRYTFQGEW